MVACTVCTDDYNAAANAPKCLPCGHIFCLDCLKTMRRLKNNTHLLCPTCQRRHDMDPQEIATIFTMINNIPEPAEQAPPLRPNPALAVPQRQPNGRGTIHISPPTGRDFSMQVAFDSVVSDLKRLIYTRTGIHPNEQQLFLGGIILGNTMTLEECDVYENSIIQMTTSTYGGR